MKTSQRGIERIKGHEGLRLTAYQCQAGVWTIGYGHTRGVKPGQRITKEEAEQFLTEDLAVAEAAVGRYVKPVLSQHEFDALVSFTFNVGAGKLKESTLLMLINQGANRDMIEGQIKRWIYAAGKPSPGLRIRRAAEASLYRNGYE